MVDAGLDLSGGGGGRGRFCFACPPNFSSFCVQSLDINAIHRINHYPADSLVCFANTYPAFEQNNWRLMYII